MAKPLELYRTAEAVRAGHPDKLCDWIADALLDRCRRLNPDGKYAFEVMGTGYHFIVGGEATGGTDAISTDQIEAIIAGRLISLGYPARGIVVENLIQPQSEEIRGKVDAEKENAGAGDMGIVYGYAEAGSYSLLPPCYALATRFMHDIDLKAEGWGIGVNADGKCMVSTFGGSLAEVQMALQADAEADPEEIRGKVIEEIIAPACEEMGYSYEKYRFDLDCKGFTLGGTWADTGLTGRKIQNDAYGTCASNGGGAFSGKDMTKVDRSGAYYNRWLAKKLIEEVPGLERAQVCSTWVLGSPTPLSVTVDQYGAKEKSEEISRVVAKYSMDLPHIIDRFTPVSFADFANYGAFTPWHDQKAPWEEA